MNEAASFALSRIDSKEAFDHFLASFLPGARLESQRQQIAEQYNCTKLFDGNYTLCITTTIRDAAFTCNTRDLYSAYPDQSHMIQYGFPAPDLANHASDLIPLFANSFNEVVGLLAEALGEFKAILYAELLINTNLSVAYQTYFASFAGSGDPNGLSLPLVAGQQPPKWPIADGSDDQLAKVLIVQAPINQEALVLASDE